MLNPNYFPRCARCEGFTEKTGFNCVSCRNYLDSKLPDHTLISSRADPQFCILYDTQLIEVNIFLGSLTTFKIKSYINYNNLINYPYFPWDD